MPSEETSKPPQSIPRHKLDAKIEEISQIVIITSFRLFKNINALEPNLLGERIGEEKGE
jgi:hypothetical protein